MATDQEKIAKIQEALGHVASAMVSIYGTLVHLWIPLKATNEENAKINKELDEVSKRIDEVLKATREAREL